MAPMKFVDGAESVTPLGFGYDRKAIRSEKTRCGSSAGRQNRDELDFLDQPRACSCRAPCRPDEGSTRGGGRSWDHGTRGSADYSGSGRRRIHRPKKGRTTESLSHPQKPPSPSPHRSSPQNRRFAPADHRRVTNSSSSGTLVERQERSATQPDEQKLGELRLGEPKPRE